MASRHKKKKRTKKPSGRRHDRGDAPTRPDELRNDFWLPTIKRRRRFSSKEIKLLQKEFSINCSPCADKVEEIADLFSTDKKIITTWFQNKRAKTKKLHANSPRTVSSVDDQTEQDQQEEGEGEDEDEVEEDGKEEEEHYASDLSSATTDMDNDTFRVMNGYTALTTPTYVLHQQEHQNIVATLSSPHYTHKHLSDYLTTYRFELYYLTMQQDEEDHSLRRQRPR
ncbi:Homeodomain-like DNA binding domain-containing transcription factor [Mucor lusitanicus]|uniref:Homeodomain-like DNA binding domain-containing transcription factor n=2 Tax=Mucor circinelloides f. lusitanicus TaxID=29924 RepID=A0A162TH33_MUCCL|nr:Homeodomain-like DNA binding domain-containing transcription factor [Mucor lusitanicus]OAD04532.1 Homeodomain-like DNA binding domain-containing transcription factor [Mucor lusitanicus CBS 277.49]